MFTFFFCSFLFVVVSTDKQMHLKHNLTVEVKIYHSDVPGIALLIKHVTDGIYRYNLIQKPTQQSSVYNKPENLGTSDRAVDGNVENRYVDRSCTHTGHDFQPWWAVDMQMLVNVVTVTITFWSHYCCCKYCFPFLLYKFRHWQ